MAGVVEAKSQSGVTEVRSDCSIEPVTKKRKSKSFLSQDSSVVAMIVDQSAEGEEKTETQAASGVEESVEVAKHDKKKKKKKEKKANKSEVSEVNSQVDKAAEEEVTMEEKTKKKKAKAETSEEEESEADQEDAGEGKKELSKSAQKKLKKQERFALKKQEMKARNKAHKKEKKEKKSEVWINLSAEEKEAAVQRAKEARKSRLELTNKRKQKLKNAMNSGQNLVIDFQFSNQMTEQEIAHMSQQIMYSYAANGKAEAPVRLSLTSLKGDMKHQLERISGHEHWLVHREEGSYMDVFADRKKEDLVYLTADSETVLEDFDASKIYIIGGIVDHNRMKCITLNKAKEQGIATARLPIQENMKLTSSSVLTVNQVVEIVLSFLHRKDWPAALKSVIPQRKLAAQTA